ncbi:ABC transporter substrate-binding protein [Fictibacillus macauensis ZFHKF-1]|uniref:ABC transporter substrate-binding protein n=1 Tax=Fictibacillus macauensis ZFHKF-1 TaxID=1196324 RepID=I8UGX1_9BACL|nr:ABC transporter substrate-binding protein [Fictibacillus macauensis]EIT86150.1 ABC transporter substrate-binding protein [Fictibacillus macauensis ZFHKF-1]
MDPKLLQLFQNTPSGPVRIDELADILALSTKQLTRSLRKWEQDGWLTYVSGRGRGVLSQLHWQKHVEQTYVEFVLEEMDTEPLEVSSKYLSYNWSPPYKQQLMKALQATFGDQQQTRDKVIVPRRNPFLATHPIIAADAKSAMLVANVYNRLVSLSAAGVFTPELAHSWDLLHDRLRLFIRKDITFHDGSCLTADDVVYCLQKLLHHPYCQQVWQPIQAVTSPAPLVVDLLYRDQCSYSLHLLSMVTASIYKETAHSLHGTGAFMLQQNDEQKTSLLAFKDHFRERPLLDAVEFIKVPSDFPRIYQSTVQPVDTTAVPHQVDYSFGFGILILSNAVPEALRHYIHRLVVDHRHSLESINLTPNEHGCLHHPVIPPPASVSLPQTMKPLSIVVQRYTEHIVQWLTALLDQHNIPYELHYLSFDETVYRKQEQCYDVLIHGEVFEMNEQFAFFYFLRNGLSPFSTMLEDEKWRTILLRYPSTPFEEWPMLNQEMEASLIHASHLIPLYYDRKQTQLSSDLMNIQPTQFGYIDLSSLWIRPTIEA